MSLLLTTSSTHWRFIIPLFGSSLYLLLDNRKLLNFRESGEREGVATRSGGCCATITATCTCMAENQLRDDVDAKYSSGGEIEECASTFFHGSPSSAPTVGVRQLETGASASRSSTLEPSIEKTDEEELSHGGTSGVTFVPYESELQLPHIMRLMKADLSEPYSIYTYRYFIHNWPNLCFLVQLTLTIDNIAPYYLCTN